MVFIDSGAQQSIMTLRAAEMAGVDVGQSATQLVGFAEAKARPAVLRTLELGTLLLHDVPVLVANSPPLMAAKGQLTLGTDLMHHVRFTLDYPQRRVLVERAGSRTVTGARPLVGYPGVDLFAGLPGTGRRQRRPHCPGAGRHWQSHGHVRFGPLGPAESGPISAARREPGFQVSPPGADAGYNGLGQFHAAQLADSRPHAHRPRAIESGGRAAGPRLVRRVLPVDRPAPARPTLARRSRQSRGRQRRRRTTPQRDGEHHHEVCSRPDDLAGWRWQFWRLVRCRRWRRPSSRPIATGWSTRKSSAPG